MRDLFAHVRAKVIEKFPQDPNIRYTALSGFIFLRFFCPAILSPKLFDLLPGPVFFLLSSLFIGSYLFLPFFLHFLLDFFFFFFLVFTFTFWLKYWLLILLFSFLPTYLFFFLSSFFLSFSLFVCLFAVGFELWK